MSNYQIIIDLVEQRTGQKQWSTQIYINITGDPLRGLFLDRVVWWSDKGTRDDDFFWKKAEDWQKEIGFGYAQLTRIAKELENIGFISLKKTNANGAPTLHYRANMEFITEKICQQIPIIDTAEIQECEETIIDNLENRISTIPKIEFRQCQDSITAKTPAKTTAKTTEDWIPGADCKALLGVCKLNWKFVRRSKELYKSLIDVLGFLGEEKAAAIDIIEFESWRKSHHWTGKSPPTLKQVGELWPQYQDWVNDGRPTPEIQQHKNGATANGYKRTRQSDRENSTDPVSRLFAGKPAT